jgi:L-lactate dehydrogenase complex protein LldG
VEQTQSKAAIVSAKDEILERIRSALGPRRGGRESDYAYIARNYETVGKRDREAVRELFVDRLQDYGATVFECTEPVIANAVETALKEREIARILVGPHFPSGWIPTSTSFRRDDELSYHEIDQIEGVLTGCAVAIAVTGTIVLRHADDEPRRAVSLIPDYHLCVVHEEQIVETVPEGVQRMGGMGAVPLTTISGPSATSDIEMTRIKGVHGPRILDVILVRM